MGNIIARKQKYDFGHQKNIFHFRLCKISADDTNGIAYVNFNRQWINYFFAGASLIIFEIFV
jgi:hypothetical protein